MKTELEQIDIIIERTGVGYQEAKAAYEKFDGSTLDAIIYLENQTSSDKAEKIENISETVKGFASKLGSLFLKVLKVKIVWKKNDQTLFECSALIMALLLLSFLPLTLIASFLPVLFGVRLSIKYGNGAIAQMTDWFKQS